MEKSNILVVDDSPSSLLLIKDILSVNEDYNIITENDGDNVLNQLNANKIDLILLDIMMPKVDGFEVCSQIKKDAGFKDIPIIFLTAKIDENSLLRGFEFGGVDYIRKPFLMSELMARVKTHIQLKKTNEKLKNVLFRHSITQQNLMASQNELSVKNIIAQYFLSEQGDGVYPKLLELILKYLQMDFGVIGYMDDIGSPTSMENKKLICPSLYSGTVDSDNSNIFSMDEIGDIALTVIRHQPIIQKSNISKLFFTQEEVNCMIAVPINYYDRVVGIVALASKNSECAESCKQKLQDLVSFVAPIIYNRVESRIANQNIINSINNTQTEERKRFAKDIHDGLGSNLTSLTTYISILKSGMLSQEEQNNILDEMQRIVSDTALDARNIANGLEPEMIGRLGIVESIKHQYERLFQNNCKTKLNFNYSHYTGNVNSKKQATIFRIVCELFNNAFKYSKATEIQVDLSIIDDKIRLSYQDNGIGFDLAETMSRIKSKKVSGLKNIMERAKDGKININVAPQKGFEIEVEI